MKNTSPEVDRYIENAAAFAQPIKQHVACGFWKAKLMDHRRSPSHKREYAEWIREAKQDVTRQRRVATAIEWMTEGKPRNWKYMKSK